VLPQWLHKDGQAGERDATGQDLVGVVGQGLLPPLACLVLNGVDVLLVGHIAHQMLNEDGHDVTCHIIKVAWLLCVHMRSVSWCSIARFPTKTPHNAAQSAAVESTGQATAEAKACTKAAQIEGEVAVTMSKLKAQSTKSKSDVELEELKLKQEAEIAFQKSIDEIELQKAKELSAIKSKKFKEIVSLIGSDTIASIAQASPEMQAKLLQGLGIQSLLITDGNSPINLFSTASGLIKN